jgi:hypothetical protein
MKTPILSSLLVLVIGTAALADADAPFIDKQIKELTKKVDGDLTAGALTQPDADELKRAISHVQSIRDSEPSLTGRTRRDLREELSKIQKDLDRKEAQAKALASASPSATP